MPPLKNEFSWSLSRRRSFDYCQRQFYLSSYAVWGGWEKGADNFSRLCYRLSRMQNLFMWAGAIVHQEIEECLKRIAAGVDADKSAGLMEQRALDSLKRGWIESSKGLWERDPKNHVNLFEHYYAQPVEPRFTNMIKERVLGALRNFKESEALQLIASLGPKCWQSLEQFQSFQLGKLKIGLKIDFALIRAGRLVIFDWKTGKPSDNDGFQGATYALYAMDAWKIPLDHILTEFVYLVRGGGLQHKSNLFNEEAIDNVRGEIFSSAMQIYTRLQDAENNVARMEDFPMTGDRSKCAKCNFFEACYQSRNIKRGN